jgi:hypothetical protein
MIKNYFLLLFLIVSCQLFSQEVYLNIGKNFTKYEYKNSDGQLNANLQSGTGNFYEVGLTKPFTDDHFIYSAGLSLNDYNAIGGNSANSYRWDTKYLGLNGGLAYSFFPNGFDEDQNLNLVLNAGLKGQFIIYGKQEIDGVYYDLVHNEEFSGLIVEPSIGFQVKYFISSFGFLSLGYNYCIGINVSNTSEEKLSFNTHQIGLGFHFPLN